MVVALCSVVYSYEEGTRVIAPRDRKGRRICKRRMEWPKEEGGRRSF